MCDKSDVAAAAGRAGQDHKLPVRDFEAYGALPDLNVS
jgi:hypothetical protein